MRLGLPAALLLAQLAPSQADAQEARPILIINHVNVVDVESGRIDADRAVVVAGSRITGIGPADDKLALVLKEVDGRGRYLIPGLWDMHVHAAFPGLDAIFFPELLANGITGVREMFSSFAWVDSSKARIARGEIPGPRMVASGHILDGTPPIWPGSVAVSDAATARRAVDSLKAGGADFIKVYSRLTPAEFFAISEEAKRIGIPFAGHVPTLVPAASASGAGQRSLEHLTNVLLGCSSREDEFLAQLAAAAASPKGWDSAGVVGRAQLEPLLGSFDAGRCRQLAKRFVANGTWMVPTIAVLHGVAFLDDTTLARDPRLRYVPAWFRSGWNPSADFRFRMLTPKDWALRKLAYGRQLEVVTLLHQEGVAFLAGTDLSNPYVLPGFSLHDELAAFVAAGFTPLEALQSATLSPARYLNATDSLGTVAVGKLADLVLLDANPLTDIKNSSRIRAVIANGRLYERAGLDKLLADAEARGKQPPGQ
jgi:imidazolonepropionase-like amidohydrolase